MRKDRRTAELEERLRRGGYLGVDRRDVAEIVETDATALARRGADAADLARRMRRLRDLGRKALGGEVEIDGRYRVSVVVERGLLVCPFGDTRSVAKTVTTVHDLRTGRSLTFSDMNIHLIERHGFFEGCGSAFRIEPDDLCDLLLDGEER